MNMPCTEKYNEDKLTDALRTRIVVRKTHLLYSLLRYVMFDNLKVSPGIVNTILPISFDSIRISKRRAIDIHTHNL